MKTIFDYNPTDTELTELFDYDEAAQTLSPGFTVFRKPVADYNNINDDEKLLDVAKLLEYRGETDAAAVIWAKIPDLHRQWTWANNDNQNIAVE
jgi:hypothetical protein